MCRLLFCFFWFECQSQTVWASWTFPALSSGGLIPNCHVVVFPNLLTNLTQIPLLFRQILFPPLTGKKITNKERNKQEFMLNKNTWIYRKITLGLSVCHTFYKCTPNLPWQTLSSMLNNQILFSLKMKLDSSDSTSDLCLSYIFLTHCSWGNVAYFSVDCVCAFNL